MSGAANRQGKKGRDGGARILSASIIGLSTLAVVAGVAFTHMKGDPAGLSLLHENPTPPRDLAQTEAARASAEKRLAEAMAIQIANLPPVKEAEQQQVVRLDPLPAQPPPMPAPTMSTRSMSSVTQAHPARHSLVHLRDPFRAFVAQVVLTSARFFSRKSPHKFVVFPRKSSHKSSHNLVLYYCFP